MSRLERLPDELWHIICSHLKVDDLSNLRLVNRNLNVITGSKRIWRARIIEKWYQYDDMQFVEDSFTDYRTIFNQKYHHDNMISHKIDTLVLSSDVKERLSDVNQLLGLNYTDSVPILAKLSTDSTNLIVSYYSKNLLNVFRFSKALRFLNEIITVDSKKYSEDFEQFWFHLSFFDKSFGQLLPYRRKVLESTISKFDKLQSMFTFSNNTEKVLKIIKLLFSSIKLNNELSYNKLYLEDFQLLRVYAGEAKGHSYLLSSIIVKICAHFDIPAYLTKNIMVVKDSTYVKGESFFMIKRSSVKVFNYNQVLVNLRLNNINTELKFNQFFRKLNIYDLLIFYFENQRCQSIKLIDKPMGKNFHISKMNFSNTDFEFFKTVYKLLVHYNSISSKSSRTGLMNFLIESELITQLQYNRFFYVPKLNEVVSNLKLMGDGIYTLMDPTTIYKKYNIYPGDRAKMMPSTQPLYHIGDIVYHERLQGFSVIVGWKDHSSLNSVNSLGELIPLSNIYYNCLTLRDNLEIYHQDSLRKIEFVKEPNPALFGLLMNELFKFNDFLGLFFKRIDREHTKLIINDDLAQLYPDL